MTLRKCEIDRALDYERDSALVLVIGDRYYAGVKNGRVTTAWSLAAAKLFGVWREAEISKAEKQISDRGKTSSRKAVTIVVRGHHGTIETTNVTPSPKSTTLCGGTGG